MFNVHITPALRLRRSAGVMTVFGMGTVFVNFACKEVNPATYCLKKHARKSQTRFACLKVKYQASLRCRLCSPSGFLDVGNSS